MIDMDQEVQVPLKMAEFLVLSDCLERLEQKLDELKLLDGAERTALWALEGWLEKLNPVIFSEHYDFYLRQAKTCLTGSIEDV
jgi:hypothetical protein